MRRQPETPHAAQAMLLLCPTDKNEILNGMQAHEQAFGHTKKLFPILNSLFVNCICVPVASRYASHTADGAQKKLLRNEMRKPSFSHADTAKLQQDDPRIP